MKDKASKLDPYAERLEEWFTPVDKGGKGYTLAQAQEQLRLDGVAVSTSRLGEWWEDRRTALATDQAQNRLLSEIAAGAQIGRAATKQLASTPAPEAGLIIQLLQTLVMRSIALKHTDPDEAEKVESYTKIILEFLKIQEKKADREFEETKFKEALRSKVEAGLDAVAEAFKGNTEAMKLYQQARAMISKEMA